MTAPLTAGSTVTPVKWWREKSVWIMLFLGFSAGIPIYLIFSSLSLWLREAGVSRSTTTFFSWAVLGYSFKFVWAPLIDKLPLPWLSKKLGRRRGWLLLAQLAVIASILLMASTNPLLNLQAMAIAAVLLGFSSATQDVVIDAYRIEIAEPRFQAMLSSTYIAGYRTGMIVAGAGALYLADFFGSSLETYQYDAWRSTYICMAATMLIGLVTTLLIPEPIRKQTSKYDLPASDYLRFFLVFLASLMVFICVFYFWPSLEIESRIFDWLYSALEFAVAIAAAWAVAKVSMILGFLNRDLLQEGYVEPVLDFFKRYGKLAVWVLLLIGFYRVSDLVLGVISNVFYQDMGYSKTDIANASKVFGVVATIVGSFIGGVLALRLGVMRVLFLGALLSAATNLLYMWLANGEPNLINLYLVISVDNVCQGIALAAFVAWLASLTNVEFTATQYALFSSLMTLFPKFFGGYSGSLVEWMGYSNFFLMTALIGVPILLLIYFLKDKLQLSQ